MMIFFFGGGGWVQRNLILIFSFIQVKELKNSYTTRVNAQVTAAQENLNIAKSSIAEIRQKVMSPC